MRILTRNTLIACAAALLFTASTAIAETFSTTNIQLLYGSRFHDRFVGNTTTDGKMVTTTLEHFGTWGYGDNYFFVDFTSGDFATFAGVSSGTRTHIYGEWSPRLSLSALSGHGFSIGPVKDVLLAGQINQSGDGFVAYLSGMSLDLVLPGFNFANLSFYARKDNFNRATWQSTGVWNLPITTGLHLEGFLDLYGTDSRGTELFTQPQLLLDAGRLFGSNNHLFVGAEWYYMRNKRMRSSVVQGMVKWAW